MYNMQSKCPEIRLGASGRLRQPDVQILTLIDYKAPTSGQIKSLTLEHKQAFLKTHKNSEDVVL